MIFIQLVGPLKIFFPDLIYPTEQLIMIHLCPTSSKTVSILAHPSIASLSGILDNVLGHVPLFSMLLMAKESGSPFTRVVVVFCIAFRAAKS